jgi:hypothetical protein
MSLLIQTYHQRGKKSMPQISLPFKYEEEKVRTGMTGLAGLPLYLELLHSLKIPEVMRASLDSGIDERTVWKPSDTVLSLILLNLSGGEHVEDLRILESDAGFCMLLERISTCKMTGSQRRAWRRNKQLQGAGTLPSRSTVFRFLKQDGDEGLVLRGQGKAYIPEAGRTVQQLCGCNQALLAALEHNKPSGTVTLDLDATLIETYKADSLYSYKGFSAYQPVNVWWDEQRVMLHTQFRDGNVPAGYALKGVLAEALSRLPQDSGKDGIFLRSDTAAYEIDFLKYCEDEKIQFVVGCPIMQELRKEIRKVPEDAWKRLDKLREYAEICFVPNSLSTSKQGYEFRYVATRELLKEQCVLPGMPEKEYPFPVESFGTARYKLHAIVTNRTIPAEKLVSWYYKRCGHSEEVHGILKNELAGGTLPCNNFHANAVWWMIAVLSHNIHSVFKQLCCAKDWNQTRLKRIRFQIICLPGRVIERGRQLYCRLSGGHPSFPLLQSIRQAITRLRPCPV